jgi:hypothetical protein
MHQLESHGDGGALDPGRRRCRCCWHCCCFVDLARVFSLQSRRRSRYSRVDHDMNLMENQQWLVFLCVCVCVCVCVIHNE